MIGGLVRRAGLLARRDLTLGTLMSSLAEVHGNRRLVEEAGGGLRLTYLQADKRVRRWAGGIAGRVDPGERVVVAPPNGCEMFLLCLAAARAGAVPVPVNPQMRPDEVDHVIADSGAALVLRSAHAVDVGEPLADAVPVAAGDVAALFYTSGTTGLPKGAQVTHRALLGTLVGGLAWPARLRRDEAVFALPIAHIMGFVVLAGYCCAGIPTYLFPRFRPVEVLDAIEARRATVFVGVPAMYRMMLEAGAAERDLSSVRLWGSGADAMPPDLAREFKRFGATATLPGIGPVGEAAFAEAYGMVEAAGGVAAKFSPPLLRVGLGDSLGFSLPGYRMRVVDEEGRDVPPGVTGEIWVSGPGVTSGYWASPEATAEAVTSDGWLRTGDLARRGPLGTVVFAGRSKDVVVHGGYTVYALEVQTVLEEHPSVLEAAVVGVPDETLGEVPVAVVRLEEGSSPEDLDLGGWAAARLAEYKVPKRFLVVDELPRTGTSKVRKAQLRELFD